MISISHPALETYFIVFDENNIVLGHGSVLPGQVMDSGAADVVQYTDKDLYLAALAAHGIVLDPESAE